MRKYEISLEKMQGLAYQHFTGAGPQELAFWNRDAVLVAIAERIEALVDAVDALAVPFQNGGAVSDAIGRAVEAVIHSQR